MHGCSKYWKTNRWFCGQKKKILYFGNEHVYWQKVLESNVTVITFLCKLGLPLQSISDRMNSLP